VKIAIIGPGGRLGREIVKLFPQAVRIGRAEIRATGTIKMALAEALPDVVINAAAMCGIEACDMDPGGAFEANAQLPLDLAAHTHYHSVKLIHISTDYVFAGGLDHPYCETDLTAPLSRYGRTKLTGEAVRLYDSNSIVLRVGSLIGDDFAGLANVIAQVNQGRGGDDPIQVLSQICSPITTMTLAKLIEGILYQPAHRYIPGLYHVGAEPIRKLEAARMLTDLVFQKDFNFVENALAQRPFYVGLNTNLFSDTFEIPMPDVIDELDIIADLYLANKP